MPHEIVMRMGARVTEPEPMVCPGAGGIVDPPPAGQPARSTREPSNLNDDLHHQVYGIDIPHVCMYRGAPSCHRTVER